jgi:hypothetical protein
VTRDAEMALNHIRIDLKNEAKDAVDFIKNDVTRDAEMALNHIRVDLLNQAKQHAADADAAARQAQSHERVAETAADAAVRAAQQASAVPYNPLCWVAREVYGASDPQWLLFRHWLLHHAPAWFRSLYLRHGEAFALWLADKPALKALIRLWMDSRIRSLPSVATGVRA